MLLTKHQSSEFTKQPKYKRLGPLTKEKLINLISVDGNGCWLWQRAKDKNGYARLGGKLVSRMVWNLFNEGKPPEVCHSCDVPSCINPEHLFGGTHHENMLDAKRKRRMGRRFNPKLTPEIYRAIRREIEAGNLMLKDIAWEYGISPPYITKIKKGDIIHASQ